MYQILRDAELTSASTRHHQQVGRARAECYCLPAWYRTFCFCQPAQPSFTMANLVLQALRPTPTGAALLAAILYSVRNSLDRSLSWSKALVFILLFINRGSFPLRWHLKLFWIAMRARLRWRAAVLGFRKPNTQQKQLGIQGGDLALGGVGRSYFDIVSTRHTKVSFAESDYNLYACSTTCITYWLTCCMIQTSK